MCSQVLGAGFGLEEEQLDGLAEVPDDDEFTIGVDAAVPE
jgi:hypothetical protein